MSFNNLFNKISSEKTLTKCDGIELLSNKIDVIELLSATYALRKNTLIKLYEFIF